MTRTLLIGYGNPNRQDDGVAWHVLKQIASNLSPDVVDFDQNDFFEVTPEIHLLFLLQLVPELAERIRNYDRVCFVDAHTGSIPEEIRAVEISANYKRSPFTHHLTPESLLEICSTIYHKQPHSMLVSVRGYEFGFEDDLSEKTRLLVPAAAEQILHWMNANK